MIAPMRLAALAVLLAACGGPRTGPAKVEVATAPPDAAPALVEPEAPVSESPVDWSAVTFATDDDARAVWRALELTGDNYYLRLEDIPRQAREPLAMALLREGNFVCAATPIQISCTQTALEFLEVPPEATIDDPCLRRRLALWAVDNLDDDTLLHELIADVVALAALPPPESELNRAVLYRVSDEPTKLQMIQAAVDAGNRAIAEESLGGLSVAGLEAAIAMHLDAAVDSLDGSYSAALGRAILDPLLRRDTRIRATSSLYYYVLDADPTDPGRQVAYDALVAGTRAPDCGVAGMAKAAVAAIDGKPFPSPLPKQAKAPAVMRAMCEMLGNVLDDPLAVWHRFVDERGLTVRWTTHDPRRVEMLWDDYPDARDANKDGAPDVDEADPDGDGDPATTHEVVHYDREQWLGEEALSDELRRAMAECKGTKCHLAATRTDFTLSFRKGRAGLVLDAIDVETTAGGC